MYVTERCIVYDLLRQSHFEEMVGVGGGSKGQKSNLFKIYTWHPTSYEI